MSVRCILLLRISCRDLWVRQTHELLRGQNDIVESFGVTV
jgi:hypothetical protein